ncbi:hypothetical protein CDO31_35250 (plasmid) [Sinorhizobium meliloti]|nr:hypothetical protein CDO31_35250 [Sinorhizobium meliloti]
MRLPKDATPFLEALVFVPVEIVYGATIWMGRRDDQDDEIGGRDLAKMDCESVRCKGGIF